jgi:hypothetical protein
MKESFPVDIAFFQGSDLLPYPFIGIVDRMPPRRSVPAPLFSGVLSTCAYPKFPGCLLYRVDPLYSALNYRQPG